jgi:hypothetical protein
MDHTSFPAVHRVETERCTATFYLFGGSEGTHAKLFHPQGAVIVGVERNARVIVGMQAQRFLRNQFQRQKKLRAVGQDQIDIRASELDHEIRIFKIGVTVITRFNCEL